MSLDQLTTLHRKFGLYDIDPRNVAQVFLGYLCLARAERSFNLGLGVRGKLINIISKVLRLHSNGISI